MIIFITLRIIFCGKTDLIKIGPEQIDIYKFIYRLTGINENFFKCLKYFFTNDLNSYADKMYQLIKSGGEKLLRKLANDNDDL